MPLGSFKKTIVEQGWTPGVDFDRGGKYHFGFCSLKRRRGEVLQFLPQSRSGYALHIEDVDEEILKGSYIFHFGSVSMTGTCRTTT